MGLHLQKFLKVRLNPQVFKIMRESMRTRSSGFTLIELLVVIAIIGLLASIVLASLDAARAKSRDALRLSDVSQIHNALELYYGRNNNYPEEAHAGCYDGWETSCDPAGNFVDQLRTGGLISKVPFDPLNNSTYFYAYYHYDAGSNGCSFAHSVIAIKKFEAGNPNLGTSAKCPGRNWYPEFDYSILLPI